MTGYNPQGYASPYANPYYSPYGSPQQRLAELEQRYPQYGQTMPPIQNQAAQAQPAPPTPQSSIMAVTSEQQAREYPLDLSGAPQIFVMNDDSKIFAKRFNVSNALPEFEVYERVSQNTAPPPSATQDNSFLLGIVGDFSSKLENLNTEILSIKEAVLNGNQLRGDSKSNGKQKSANATDSAAGSGDAASGK